MSADSGLAVYKDIASVPAWHNMDLTYADLCDPMWITKGVAQELQFGTTHMLLCDHPSKCCPGFAIEPCADPEIFFGFWGTCLNNYMETPQHQGYELLAR